jgi:hypothetical protein
VRARPKLVSLFVTAVAMLVGAPAPADPPSAAPPPVVEPPFEGAIPYGDIPPGSLVWHPWRLFDPYLSPRAAVLTGGLFHDRAMGTDAEHSGFSLAGGPSIESRYGFVFLRAQMQYGFRLVGEKELTADLAQFGYTAGVAVGPLEIHARAGVTGAERVESERTQPVRSVGR